MYHGQLHKELQTKELFQTEYKCEKLESKISHLSERPVGGFFDDCLFFGGFFVDDFFGADLAVGDFDDVSLLKFRRKKKIALE